MAKTLRDVLMSDIYLFNAKRDGAPKAYADKRVRPAVAKNEARGHVQIAPRRDQSGTLRDARDGAVLGTAIRHAIYVWRSAT